MNWLVDFNFWVFGPFVIWALVGAIVYNAFIQRRAANKVSMVLEKIFSELTTENGELRKATSELKADTFALTNIIIGLKGSLEGTRTSIDSLRQSLHKIYFWIPLGGDNKK